MFETACHPTQWAGTSGTSRTSRKRATHRFWSLAVLALCALPCAGAVAPPPADAVFWHGYIYTVDSTDSVQEALAIRNGSITYVGSDKGAEAWIGKNTVVTDLQKRVVMPGLIDGHMHPFGAGDAMTQCDLNRELLTIERMQQRIQACLDASRDKEPDGWLRVSNWFQEAMIPAGVTATRAVLDELHTERPIWVMSSFFHTALLNTRGLALTHITADSPDPTGGKIGREPSGAPSGILEDGAYQLALASIPPRSAAEDIQSAEIALQSIRSQGITSFLDAAAEPRFLDAFVGAEKDGKLTARAHFAILIKRIDGRPPAAVVSYLKTMAARYDQGAIVADPRMTVRNVKFILDGVINAPALSGAMLQPYYVNTGDIDHPRWEPSKNRGPDVFFPAPLLKTLIIESAKAGFDPHLHADGDRAAREALDAIQAMRQALPGQDVRAAIAHDEIVDPSDFPRYRQWNAIPVLSFQWESLTPDVVDSVSGYLGPARYMVYEPAGLLARAGARITYGSDWPVDPLNEWYALQVGMTRTALSAPNAPKPKRLGEDPGLSRKEALRAITMNAAYELHQEQLTGSLEVGKLADFIILDRNVLEIPVEQIGDTRVLKTFVGGRVVYDADSPARP